MVTLGPCLLVIVCTGFPLLEQPVPEIVLPIPVIFDDVDDLCYYCRGQLADPEEKHEGLCRKCAKGIDERLQKYEFP